MSTTRTRQKQLLRSPIAPFANDPVRSTGSLTVNGQQVQDLQGPSFLSTALVDFLLQQVLKDTISPNVLIGSSNSMSFFEISNNKVNDQRLQDATTKRSISRIREAYQPYSQHSFRFLAANCTQSHFFVVDVTFDIQHESVFPNVTMYDSLRKTSRRDQGRLNPHSQGAQFLLSFQHFLAQYCFVGGQHHQSKLLLQQKPDLILQHATVCPCPQQLNGHDCALFAFAVVTHLARGIAVDEKTFTQNDISHFRAGLYQHLSTGNQSLPPNYISTYFPNLPSFLPQPESQLHNNVIDGRSMNQKADDVIQCEQKNDPNDADDDSSYDDNASTVDELEIKNAPELGTNEQGKNEDEQPQDDNEHPPVKTLDVHFMEMFYCNDDGEDITYDTPKDIAQPIANYEEVSKLRLVIRKSYAEARTYCCASHEGCCFKAKFGPKRGKNYIVLKKNQSIPYHCGVAVVPIGRSAKGRIQMKVLPLVAKVAMVKDGDPTARDVMKASGTLKGFAATYQQAYRAVAVTKSLEFTTNERSFKLVLPYLEKFNEINPNSVTLAEKDEATNRLQRLFVCPGIMDLSLKHVRPIMSLDAAHLKSIWRGTLYVASVKSACNEIYPVAVAIMEQNENLEGWRWFLANLKRALPTLILPHPRKEVTKKYFTFMSDRQKGLLEALAQVFPENHSCYCAVHIARNVQTKYGKKMSKYVLPLASTFSPSFADELLSKMSEDARKYVEDIPSSGWRNTEWVRDETLPPRFGIRTSNMSEAANSMFEHARNGSWLHSLHIILTKMVERIAVLRLRHKERTGVVESVVCIMKKRWDLTAHYWVVELEEDNRKFSVFRNGTSNAADENGICPTVLDLEHKRCNCGEWQEHGVPCVHALTYFRQHEKATLEDCLEHVDIQYTYKAEQQLLQKNIVPVCVGRIFPDGITLPPGDNLVRAPGRPKKKRLRARSKWCQEPEKSPIVCSRCSQRGHNVRTCLTREALIAEAGAVVVETDQRRRKYKRSVENIKEMDLS